MGHKVHPIGFRIGVHRDWLGKWYADKHYMELLQEDLKIRNAITSGYPEAGIARVEIERQANQVTITIFTARPGIVIGRSGQRVDEMRQKGLTKVEMATRMRTSRTAVDRLLDPKNISVTLNTLEKAALVIGKKLSIRLG